MNILYICDEYPPARSGGIGTVTKTVAEAMAARGHKVYVAGGQCGRLTLPEESVAGGVTVFRTEYLRRFRFLFRRDKASSRALYSVFSRTGLLDLLSLRQMRKAHASWIKIIREKSIDMVEIPDYLTLGSHWDKIRPAYPVPVVARSHGSHSFMSFYNSGSIPPASLKDDAAFYRDASLVLATSRFSADFVREKLCPGRKCEVVYNPVVIPQGIETSASGSRDIVFLGKVIRTKGAFSLIEAFKLFSPRHPEYRLVLIGRGDIAGARGMVPQELKEKVVFTGVLSRDEALGIVGGAAFCVVPSYFENFSMAALEIMGLGKALVYTNTSSGPETVEDGTDGLLCDPEDEKDIAAKMELLATDDGLRRKLGENAAERIRSRFSVGAIVPQIEKHYLNLTTR